MDRKQRLESHLFPSQLAKRPRMLGGISLNRLSPALVVPFFVCILVGNVAGHFAAVAEAEAEPAKQRAAATADVAGHLLM